MTTLALGWKYIVIHHSTTPDGETLNWHELREYHTSYRIDYESVSKEEFNRRKKISDGRVFELPWEDIGYHFGVEKIDGNYEVLFGRPLTKQGAHCKQRNMNHEGIGICFVGNYDAAYPPDMMMSVALERLIKPLCIVFDIPWNRIIGHREVTGVRKSCPGANWDLDALRDQVRSELR